jgi:hypothetical protein
VCSSRQTNCRAVSPWHSAFCDATALPAAVVGPVLCLASLVMESYRAMYVNSVHMSVRHSKVKVCAVWG